MKGRFILLNGNIAVAMGAMDSGVQFAGVYPLTPSSEAADYLAREMVLRGLFYEQKEDEIGAIGFTKGGAILGRAMTITSGPGLALMSENVGDCFQKELPVVILDVMRGGPSTGLPTRVSQGDILYLRNPTPGDVRSIVLAPGSALECYTETCRAFDLADRFMQPIFIASDESIAHAEVRVSLDDLEKAPKNTVKRRTDFSETYQPYARAKDEPAILNPFFTGKPYHMTGLCHDEKGLPTEDAVLCQKLIERQFNKVNAHLDKLELNKTYLLDDAEYLIICVGSVGLSVMDAIDRMRESEHPIKVGMFRPLTIWPSPEKAVEELAKKFPKEKILVVELNMGQYKEEIERLTGYRPINFLGQANGRPLDPRQIEEKIRSMCHD
jgi:2-oxoglutarate ferredoxin oxidoreductase subunit alpha